MKQHRTRRTGLVTAVAGAVIALCAVATPAVALPGATAASPTTTVVHSAGEWQRGEDERPTGPLIARYVTDFETMTLRHAVEGGGATLENDFFGEYWGYIEFSAADVAPPTARRADWMFGSFAESPAAGVRTRSVLLRLGADVTAAEVRTDHGPEPLRVVEGYALASWQHTAPDESNDELPVTLHLADGTQYDTELPAP